MSSEAIFIAAPRLFSLICLILFFDQPSVGLFCAALALSTFWFLSAWRRRHFTSELIWAFLMVLSFQMCPDFEKPVDIAPGRFEGIILEKLENGQGKYIVQLQKRREPFDEDLQLRLGLQVFGEASLPVKSRIAFFCKLKTPRRFLNPGVRDNGAFWQRRGLSAICSLSASAVQILSQPSLGPLQKWREKIETILEQIQPHGKNLWKATAWGENQLTPEENKSLRDTGLMHLVVISGMHFALLNFCCFFIFSKASRRFKKLIYFFPAHQIAALLSLPLLATYAALAESSSSIRRSFLMIFLGLVAVIFSRRARAENIFLLSAFINLLFWPWDLFSLSFQLSYLCVLSLLMLVKFQKYFLHPFFSKNFLTHLLQYFSLIFFSSFTIQLMLSPLLSATFDRFSMAGIWNNLWAIPYFDFLMMPLVFLGLLAPIFPSQLNEWIFYLWDVFSELFFKIVHWSSQYPGIVWQDFAITNGMLFWFYFFVISYFLIVDRRIKFFLCLLCLFQLGAIFHGRMVSPECRVTMFDVGQGEAVLIQSEGRHILIDTGGLRGIDLARAVLIPALRSLGVDHLDALVLTHSDFDHMGAAQSLLSQFSVEEIWHGTSFPDFFFADREVRSARFSHLRQIDENFEIHFGPFTRLTCLWPGSKKMRSSNDQGLVLKLSHFNQSVLFTADVSASVERELLMTKSDMLSSRILKLGHHGSKTSSSEIFIQRVNPDVALASVGRPSPFGHPAQEVVERLRRMKIELYRTDQDGAIILDLKKNDVNVELWNRPQLFNPWLWY